METLAKDLQLAVRMLLKKPGFTVIAVLTLALGIAVNATMFSMVRAFFLRRPPGRDPHRIAAISSVNPNPGFQADSYPVSAPNYLAWREGNHVFSEMAAAAEDRFVNLTSQGQSAAAGQPDSLRSTAVSLNYFGQFGVSTQLGRTFEPGEDQSGRDHVVILSHDLWERRFGSDVSAIGRIVRLNREDYTVIGVMPESFRLLGFTPHLWTPLVITSADQTVAARNNRSLRLFGRPTTG